MSEMNYWVDPEKITESFVWFCFSKVKPERLEGYVLQYKEDMRKFILWKKLFRNIFKYMKEL